MGLGKNLTTSLELLPVLLYCRQQSTHNMLSFPPAKLPDVYHEGPSHINILINILCIGSVVTAVWTKASSVNSIVEGFQWEDCTWPLVDLANDDPANRLQVRLF